MSGRAVRGHRAARACRAALAAAAGRRRRRGVLRVCADPNNLPFSDRSGEGFENHLAALLASDRGARLEYTWWAQRRGFLRNTLAASRCDVVMGMPLHAERVKTTQPYYRSSYVFVSRAGAGLDITSLDDPRLRQLRIGVQMIGDDASNSPPAHALERPRHRPERGRATRYSAITPGPARSRRSSMRSRTATWTSPSCGDRRPATSRAGGRCHWSYGRSHPSPTFPALPFAFDIAMAVRPGDAASAAELDDFIGRRRGDIERDPARLRCAA